ncbi:MAG: serine/threonine-protein kinase [Aquabacterium sp.]
MSTPTQPAEVTQPYDEEVERSAADDIDTVAETRPLPEQEPLDRGRLKPELMPSIGHIGRYALKYVIGEGGLGTVYAAHDPLLSRLIAIKTLHVDMTSAEQFDALFLNEAKAAGSLNHPHIVTMYDAGTSEQGTYIAMEMLRGKDLRQLLAMGWKPTPVQAALIVRRVADALSYAHHKGVIHRDIKPANIFMVGRTQPRVLDFGIARIRQAESLAQRDDPQSRFQEIVGGSPYYMAPEQVQHKPVDRRVDVYALGVVLYELLVYRRAFSGNSLEEIADAVLNKPVPLPHEVNPDVPVAVSEIVARAMHRDPEQRTRSARRLAHELREWLNTVDGGAAEAEMARRKRMPKAARPGLWSVAAAGWLAVALGVGLYAWQLRQSGQARVVAARPVVVGTPARTAAVPVTKPEPVIALVEPVASAVPAVADAASATGVVQAASAEVLAASAAVANEAAPAQAMATDAKVKAHAAAPVAATGVLKLSVIPWGEVWVDGRSMGVTPPLPQLRLPVGAHVVVVRNGDSPEFKQTVDVQAGKTLQIKHNF